MKWWWNIVLLFLAQIVWGQSPLRFAERVLPAQEQPYEKILALTKDPFGFVWLGTDAGLYRFDGQRVEAASQLVADSMGLLVDQAIRLRIIDSVLYVGTRKEGIVLLDTRSYSMQQWPSLPNDTTTLADPRITHITPLGADTLCAIGVHLHGVDVVTSTGKVQHHLRPSLYLNTQNPRSIDVVSQLYAHPNGKDWWLATLEGLIYYDRLADTMAQHVPGERNTVLGEVVPQSQVIRSYAAQGDSVLWLGTWGGGLLRFSLTTHQFRVFYFEPNPFFDAFTNNIRNLSWINDTTLLVAATHGQMYTFRTTDFTFESWLPAMGDQQPHGIYTLYSDAEGVWLGDANGDLWQVDHSLQAWYYVRTPKKVKAVTDVAGETVAVVSDSTGQLYLQMDNGLSPLPYSIKYPNPFFRQLLTYKNQVLVITNRSVYSYGESGHLQWRVTNDQLVEAAFNQRPPSILDAAVYEGKLWLATKGSGLLSVALSDRSVASYHTGDAEKALVHNYWINTLEVVGNTLWYGTEEGIGAIMSNRALQYSLDSLRTFLPGLQKTWIKEVFDLHDLGAGNLLLLGNKSLMEATFEQGELVRISPLLKAPLQLSFRRLYPVADSLYWLHTDEGWYQWRVGGALQSINLPDALKAARWLSSAQGILLQQGRTQLSIPRLPVFETKPAILYLSDVRLGVQPPLSTVLQPQEDWRIPYSSNYLHFGAHLISHRPQPYTSIQYRLLGADEVWRSVAESGVTINNLAPGTYTLEIQAVGYQGQPQSAIWQQRITIVPPFWRTAWFLGGSGGLLLLLLVGGYQLRIHQVRQQERLKKSFLHQIQELEVKALRAQMNPHFMFNCLNSIRNLMLKEETEEAVEYITQFSQLLRLILQHSKQELITLEEEWEALSLYLSLEELRLEEKLQFSLTVADGIDPASIQLPPMICQPYVENAIWHGLLNRPEGGKVTIAARQVDEFLYITIEDNGVGRAQAKVIKERHPSNKRQSFGMSLIKDRLAIMQAWKDIDTSVEITDLYEGDTPAGTRVTIKLKTP